MSRSLEGDVERHRLAGRLSRAIAGLPTPPSAPVVVVDLDGFDANARDLARRAAGTPLRVATKSLRVPALVSRALAAPGFHGVLAYTLREALWLHEQGLCDDILLGYPTVDREAVRRLLTDPAAARAVTLMVDDPAHLDLVDDVRSSARSTNEVRVAIDVDAGLRLGRWRVGPRRSPLHEVADVVRLARDIGDRPGMRLVGVMTYEGQVAGVPDAEPGLRAARSLAVTRLKDASVRQLAERRAAIADALGTITTVELWNAGGSGSIETSAADPTVTEVSAGSGLLVPALFDHFRGFEPRPAAFFGVPVVRRPSDRCATVAGGGLVASGPAGADRLPVPWAPPGLRLTALEGAGEVQTPLVGAVGCLKVGDLVWFRHAKSGEPAEHACEVHLVSGDRVVDVVATYRGTGHAW